MTIRTSGPATRIVPTRAGYKAVYSSRAMQCKPSSRVDVLAATFARDRERGHLIELVRKSAANVRELHGESTRKLAANVLETYHRNICVEIAGERAKVKCTQLSFLGSNLR